ncbi:DUF4158 domain-containing protein [Klebsiella pneumoniae]|uniref:DUF4158 domain-containing protein n=2 Tax=Enterobacterales TaxID=91347 RepID=UPI00222819DF|nr:DUF4158 domain-containing protein [Klebsiella pneumoniae]
MSRRHIFTERQRAALFDLPTDELSLLKFYTLGDDDLENIRQRRRPENRIGFALQLCALRYPGRALAPGEMIPREVLSFVGAQLGVPADALLTYATRRQTRQQHMDTLREIYGYKTFTGRGARDLREWTFGGTVAKLAMRQPFVLFKGLTFQKLCLPGAFRPGDHHNKMLRPGLCVVHASPQYL